MQRNNVRPFSPPLTELDARELLAKRILSLSSEHGPKRVGKALGCDEKTVRNARDEKSTLRIDYAFNLLSLDPGALDAVLEHFGRRSVPLGAACDTDIPDRARGSRVLKAALALSVALEDDEEISPQEVRDNRKTIEDAIDDLNALLGKLVKAA